MPALRGSFYFLSPYISVVALKVTEVCLYFVPCLKRETWESCQETPVMTRDDLALLLAFVNGQWKSRSGSKECIYKTTSSKARKVKLHKQHRFKNNALFRYFYIYISKTDPEMQTL